MNATDYVALPIQLAIQAPQGGTFTLKAEHTTALLESGNKFYFEDTETEEIFEINEDFAYTFSVTQSDSNRFRMYWNGIPEQLSVKDMNLIAESVVYKDADLFKVRFAEDWNRADVYVYNLMGQLVHSAKQVNTSSDYVLPLRGQAAAYIIKAVGDNGNVMTQKIISK